MPTSSTPPDPARRPASGSKDLPDDEKRPQDSLGTNIFAYLLSGVVLFGGLGWLLDRWLDTSFIVAIGMLGGTALSLYLVWVRYGSGR